jgi:Right handed beta helix region/RTX calcium-binding nonapeptide repeat (4 copies)
MALTVPTGLPTADNTGVPPGTTLTPYNGTLHVTTNGAVIENLDINGQIVVDADNVTIRNCRVTTTQMYGICGRPMTIQNCEIDGKGVAPGSYGIMASGTFTGNNIHGFENGIGVADSNTTIKNNYIHDLQAGGADPHYDGIAVQGGEGGEGNILIENNTIISRDTSDIFIKNDFGPISNVTVNHNFLAGDPGYNVYVDGRASGGPITGVTITDNYLQKGHWGYLSIDNSSPVVSNNHEFLPGDPIPGGTTTGSDGSTGSTGGGTGGTGGSTGGTSGGGTTVDHTFMGTSGDDVLPAAGQSSPGNDAFNGLGGNDLICGGPGADKIDGGNGIDTASYAGSKAAVNVDLNVHTASGGDAAGDTLINIENLTGSSFADHLTGDAGANVLDGGAGADVMRGGAGDDIYIVDNPGDVVDEGVAGSDGSDTVKSWISFNLNDTTHVLGLVGNLTLLGTANINGTGNALETRLIGNSGNNRLDGGAGNDTITGGAGHDTFVFSSKLNAATNVDRITDFNPAEDMIGLSRAVFKAAGSSLSAGEFYVGTAAHDGNDHIIYNSTTGALIYDSNGNAAGGATQFATISSGLTLTAADFVMV